MSITERARELAERVVYEGPDSDICGSTEAIRWHAKLIEQALLAERRLAKLEDAEIALEEQIDEVGPGDDSYNMAIKHVVQALRAAAEKEVAK